MCNSRAHDDSKVCGGIYVSDWDVDLFTAASEHFMSRSRTLKMNEHCQYSGL